MANTNLYSVLSFISFGAAFVTYLVAFVFVIMRYRRNPKTSSLLLIGLAFWAVPLVISMFLNVLLARVVGIQDIALYHLTWGIARSLLHAIGLGFLLAAAYTNRETTTTLPTPGQQGNATAGDNPYTSPPG